jgi:hypothetical protein
MEGEKMRLQSVLGIRAAVFIAMGALCPGASAAVIFDNLSNGGNGFFGVSSTSWEAQRFNSDATNGKLTTASFSLSAFGGEGQYRVSLYSDVAGQPGALIGTLFDGSAATKPPNGIVQFAGLSQGLAPNTNYWIVLSVPLSEPTSFGWEVTGTLTGTGSGFQTASKTSSNQGAAWLDRSAPHKMQLIADVPEPAAVGLVLLGGAGWLMRRRVRLDAPAARRPQCGTTAKP